jgi:hypothetical protein
MQHIAMSTTIKEVLLKKCGILGVDNEQTGPSGSTSDLYSGV